MIERIALNNFLKLSLKFKDQIVMLRGMSSQKLFYGFLSKFKSESVLGRF